MPKIRKRCRSYQFAEDHVKTVCYSICNVKSAKNAKKLIKLAVGP